MIDGTIGVPKERDCWFDAVGGLAEVGGKAGQEFVVGHDVLLVFKG